MAGPGAPGAHGAFTAGICGPIRRMDHYCPGLGDGFCAHDQADMGEAVQIVKV